MTGKNIAELCRLEYSRTKSLVLWVMVEMAIIGRSAFALLIYPLQFHVIDFLLPLRSDIQEVLGSAIAIQILFKIPLWAGCLVSLDTQPFEGNVHLAPIVTTNYSLAGHRAGHLHISGLALLWDPEAGGLFRLTDSRNAGLLFG